jgi:large subunit ribosomal protein L15
MELVSIKSKDKKRVGRGLSAGQGKTAGRGTKGQKSRSGYNIPRKFEGGQTPLSMRLAKLPGFKSGHEKAVIISLDQISTNYKAGEEVSLKSLAEKGLIRKTNKRVKVLNNGKLAVAVKFAEDVKISNNVVMPKAEKPEVKEETQKTETAKKSPAKKPATKKETK